MSAPDFAAKSVGQADLDQAKELRVAQECEVSTVGEKVVSPELQLALFSELTRVAGEAERGTQSHLILWLFLVGRCREQRLLVRLGCRCVCGAFRSICSDALALGIRYVVRDEETRCSSRQGKA